MSEALTGTQKAVLVTGCSKGGIGFALCEEFAARGCIVYATSRRVESMDGLSHPNVRKQVLDVTKGDDIERVVQTILAESGKIDIVVNNAGAITIGPVVDATIDQIRNAFELNTIGALRVSNAVVQASMFKRKEGLIVNIGSVSGQITTPWNTLYCAAKAALHSISEGLAMECKPFGVKVMLVAPGGVISNIARNQEASLELSPTTMYKEWESRIRARMTASQGNRSMATKEFAQRLVKQALSASPPPYMTLGYNSTLFYILQWLPRQFALWLMYRAFIG